MIVYILYVLLLIPLIFVLILFLLLLAVALYTRVKLEPVRGVCKSKERLDGKIALVTGGNQGIGLETVRDLASRGAKVIIACRDAKKAAEGIEDIAATTGNKQVEFKHLDLAKFSSVRKFAEYINNTYDRLDILVNNAGCDGVYPEPTEDGNEVVMQVNYFGHFLLTNLLLDKLIASKPSRIIIVSSWMHVFARLKVNDLHEQGFSSPSGQLFNYANSKLCDLLWMKALAKRLPEGVTVNTLHPGAVKTDIFKTLPFFVSGMFHVVANALMFRTPKEGAQTVIHLCVSEEVETVRGKHFMECEEREYSSKVDDDELVELVWNKSIQVKGDRGQDLIGDVVIIVDESLPRGTWPRGRIVKVFPGKDGVNRVVDVAMDGGTQLHPFKPEAETNIVAWAKATLYYADATRNVLIS